ncbi:putative kinesin light chain [Aspergillus lucknowensis]|uniref:Kinesin light chain n=1 Tax=Aspergillus lucknowensis TaxID=176173 RepID=A0ABR4LKD0_9EURO
MRPRNRNGFAIAIICALPLEADAVEALFDETYDRLGRFYGKQQRDMNAYINGRIGKHDVVLCYLPGTGKGSAASVASSLTSSYPGIELALVVGICGGAPPPPKYQEIFLGDVIISDSVVEYDFGKQYDGGFQRKTGVKDTLGRPGREIRALLNGLRAENARIELQDQTQRNLRTLQQKGAKWHRPEVRDNLFDALYLHKHHSCDPRVGCSCLESDSPDDICEAALGQNCDDLECNKAEPVRYREPSEAIQTSIYIGTVASADRVMKSGQHRDEIVRKEKVIGFEMEGAGVWDNVPCIVIKGVCTYADSHMSTLWQPYAAATGASAAKAFLDYWMPVNHEDASKTRHLLIPFERNSHLVGRHDEIRKLEDLISISGAKVAITGLGGVGKTQVALEFAYRMRDTEPECSIFWVPCTSYEAVEQACMAIAQIVGLEDVKPAEATTRVKTYFSQSDEKWLLIFDNADDTDMWINGSDNTPPLKDLLTVNNHGHVIFTTRNRELAVDLTSPCVIQIRELDEKTGIEFLERSLLRTNLLHDQNTAIALLEQLTFLPLAISQAIAYINKKDITLSDYLILLEEQEADVVELLSKDFGSNGRYKDIQNPIVKTWLISFNQIRKVNQLAAEYLSLMACVNSRTIPPAFLPQPGSKLEMTDALGLLSAYSFITIQPTSRSISLHPLVYLAARNWMRKEQRFSLYIAKAAEQMDEIFPSHDHANRQIWREYLPHALSLLSEPAFRKQQGQYTYLVQRVASCLYSDGRYNEAENILVQVLETRKQVLGPERPQTLTSMNNLAHTWKSLGKVQEALSLMDECAKLSNKVLGADHPDTKSSFNAVRDWEEAQNRSSAQLTCQNPPARPMRIRQSSHSIDLDSKPVRGKKWLAFWKNLQRR